MSRTKGDKEKNKKHLGKKKRQTTSTMEEELLICHFTAGVTGDKPIVARLKRKPGIPYVFQQTKKKIANRKRKVI